MEETTLVARRNDIALTGISALANCNAVMYVCSTPLDMVHAVSSFSELQDSSQGKVFWQSASPFGSAEVRRWGPMGQSPGFSFASRSSTRLRCSFFLGDLPMKLWIPRYPANCCRRQTPSPASSLSSRGRAFVEALFFCLCGSRCYSDGSGTTLEIQCVLTSCIPPGISRRHRL